MRCIRPGADRGRKGNMTLTQEEIDRIHTLFSFFSIPSDQIIITDDPELVTVSVEVPENEAGMYIGRFASTIDSIQLIVSIMVNKDVEGDHRHVLVDIGGYRNRRSRTLEEMVERVSQEVEATGIARALPPISSTERRQVHLMMADHDRLTTYSQGDGRDRRLFIALRSSV